MKKVTGLFFAVVMMFSIVFISEAISSNTPFSAQAQVRVRRRGNRSIASRTYRGGKYVAHKTVRGTVYVSKKTYQGGKYVTKKTVKGTRYTSHKVKRGTKSVFSKTKKVVVGQ